MGSRLPSGTARLDLSPAMLRDGSTPTSDRKVPLSQGRTVLYATRPKTPARLVRATRSRWDAFSASLSFRVRREEYLGDFSYPCPPDLKVRFSVSAKCAKRRRPDPIQSGDRGFEAISLQSSSTESVANLTRGTQEPQQKIPPARSAFPIWQQTHRWQVPDVRPAKQCDNTTVNAPSRRPRRNHRANRNGMGGGAS